MLWNYNDKELVLAVKVWFVTSDQYVSLNSSDLKRNKTKDFQILD